MRTKRLRDLGLLLATLLLTGLSSVGLLRLSPGGVAPPQEQRDDGPQEPPAAYPLLNRLVSATSASLHRRTGDPAQEHLDELGVSAWHRAGQRGAGVTVAVLDSGLRGYRSALGKVLPSKVLVRSFRKDGRLEARDSQHGVLCAEIIHRLAPDARLVLANWEPERPESFLAAVRWARSQGAGIVSCSLIMPSWSDGEGNGGTHRELRQALGDASQRGAGLFFASAGNTAQRHWGGPMAPAGDGWHQWAKGRKENTIRPWGDDRVSVELTGCPEGSCELAVRDLSRNAEVGKARPGAGGVAVVRFEPRTGARYAAKVRQLAPGQPGRVMHLTVLGGKLGLTTAEGSVPFPGDGDEVVAVGAVDERGRRQAYSSRGPNGRGPKPDLAAVVPFPSRWRPEQPFAGTSAAAPQAAALAALVWGRYPNLTAQQVRDLLGRHAKRPTQRPCPETGMGVIRLP